MVNYRLLSYGTDVKQFICPTDTHSNDSFHHSSVKKQPKKTQLIIVCFNGLFLLNRKMLKFNFKAGILPD